MRGVIKKICCITLCAVGLQAMEYSYSMGMHDFVVSDIVNDVPADGIEAGTSHTFGLNVGVYAEHTTPKGIHLLAKAEAFLDRDKDHLDPDHIPIWFDFAVDVDGVMHKFDDVSSIKWYAVADNRQNTVSCVEREVRQHVGIGYSYQLEQLQIDLNAYLGFYYIEFDDDTPVARGYTRQATDDGEASHALELKLRYNFLRDYHFSAKVKRYQANTGAERLEDNIELQLSDKNIEVFGQKSQLHLKVKYVKYDLERFFLPSVGVDILPFDNDTLVQMYYSFKF